MKVDIFASRNAKNPFVCACSNEYSIEFTHIGADVPFEKRQLRIRREIYRSITFQEINLLIVMSKKQLAEVFRLFDTKVMAVTVVVATR